MKTELETLRRFWNALPDARAFDNHFSSEVGRIEDIEREITAAQKRVADLVRIRAEIQQKLKAEVERLSENDWTQNEIQYAKENSLF